MRRRHQHHAVQAVNTSTAPVFPTAEIRVVTLCLAGTSTASVLSAADLNLASALAGVVALRHVNEPPLPAGDWQHYRSTCGYK